MACRLDGGEKLIPDTADPKYSGYMVSTDHLTVAAYDPFHKGIMS